MIFATRKDGFSLKVVLAGYLLLFVCLGLPLLFAPREQLQFHWALLIPAAIGLLMLYVLTQSLFKLFIRYRLTDQALICLLPPWHRRPIPLAQIAAASLWDADATQAHFEASLLAQEELKASMDLHGYIRLLMKQGPAYRYLSVAPRVETRARGAMEQIDKIQVQSQEQMVVLRLHSGASLFLSPASATAFIDALDQRGVPIQTAPEILNPA